MTDMEHEEGPPAEAENGVEVNGNDMQVQPKDGPESPGSPLSPGSPEASTAMNGSTRPYIRYSKQELMDMKSYPHSNVKPDNFDASVDKDVPNSFLRKTEKEEEEKRPRRRDRGDRGERGERGERGDRGDRDRADRGDRGNAPEDMEDSKDTRRRGRKHDYDDQEEWQDWRRHDNKEPRWGKTWPAGPTYGEQEDGEGDWKGENVEWDMPVGKSDSFADCTLGDIRKFKPQQTQRGADRLGETKAVIEEAHIPQFNFNEGLAEEHRSKAWSKWVSRPDTEAKPSEDKDIEKVPVVTAPAPVVAPAPAPKLAGSSAERPPHPVAPGVLGNSAVTGMDPLPKAPHNMKSRQPPPHNAPPYQWPEQAPSNTGPLAHTTNSAGRSILSMLKTAPHDGRPPEPPGQHGRQGQPHHGHPGHSGAHHAHGHNQHGQHGQHGKGHGKQGPPAHEANANQSQAGQPKLTVHDLFQIAQGQQLPQMPAMSNAGGGAGDEQEKARKAARDLWESSRATQPGRPYRLEDQWSQDPYGSAMNAARVPTAQYGNQHPAGYAGRQYGQYADRVDRYDRSATLTATHANAKAPLGQMYSTQGGVPRLEDTAAVGLQSYQATATSPELAGHGARPTEGEEEAGCSQS